MVQRVRSAISGFRFADRTVVVIAGLELFVLWELSRVSQVQEIIRRHLSGDYGAAQNMIALLALAALLVSFAGLLIETWWRTALRQVPGGWAYRTAVAVAGAAYLAFVAASLARPVATFQLVTAAASLCLFFAFLNSALIALRRSRRFRWVAATFAVATVSLHLAHPDYGDVVKLIEDPANDRMAEYYRVFDFQRLAEGTPPGYRCTETHFPAGYGPDIDSAYDKANSMRDFEYAGSKPATFQTDFRCLYFLHVFGPRGRWPEVRKSFSLWLSSRPDREAYEKAGRPYPVFLISAQGGGIYAAAHVSLFLARLQDACPSFAQHVFVISSVSGGSIGATVFSSSVAEDRPTTTLGCPAPSSGNRHEERVARFLSSDFLTPVINSMLGPNLVNGALTTRVASWHRASILKRYFERTWLDQNGGRDLWSEGVAASWRPSGINPAILFNVTEVATGRRTVIAPFGSKWDGDKDYPSFDQRLPDQTFATQHFYRRGMTVGDAAVTSARFPFITPPASIAISESDQDHPRNTVAAQFVDGGYADNSGAETLGELVRLLASGTEKVDLHVLAFASRDDFRANVVGQPGYDASIDIPWFHISTDPRSRSFFGEASGPLVAFAQARAFHAEAAIRNLAELMLADCSGGDQARCFAAPAFIRVPIDTETLGLPLGWTLSRASVQRLRTAMWSFSTCPIAMPPDGFRDSAYIRRRLASYDRTPEGQILRAVAHDEADEINANELRQEGDATIAPSDLDALVDHPDCTMVQIQQILSGSLARTPERH